MWSLEISGHLREQQRQQTQSSRSCLLACSMIPDTFFLVTVSRSLSLSLFLISLQSTRETSVMCLSFSFPSLSLSLSRFFFHRASPAHSMKCMFKSEFLFLSSRALIYPFTGEQFSFSLSLLHFVFSLHLDELFFSRPSLCWVSFLAVEMMMERKESCHLIVISDTHTQQST